MDEIVAFAELEQFIDQQVKFYSSGMFVRLGFAVAINVDPDVLLVDEVLAVGDEVFQKKCLDRVEAFQKEGRTILFVTHGADLVRRICNRAVVLHHGEMVANGSPGESIRIFREHLHGHLEDVPAPGRRRPARRRVDRRRQPRRTRAARTGRTCSPASRCRSRSCSTPRRPSTTPCSSSPVFDTEGRQLYSADTDVLARRCRR